MTEENKIKEKVFFKVRKCQTCITSGITDNVGVIDERLNFDLLFHGFQRYADKIGYVAADGRATGDFILLCGLVGWVQTPPSGFTFMTLAITPKMRNSQ